MKPVVLVPEYSAFLTEVKGRIQSARLSAGRAVNRELVMLYWEIGRGILEKQAAVGWGESVVERLSADLRAEFPDMRGFSISNIWRMRQMFQTFNTPDFLAQFARESGGIAGSEVILAQAVRELASAIPWGHHVEILNKLTEPAPRLHYLKATAKFGWSRAVLLNQIKAQAYERARRRRRRTISRRRCRSILRSRRMRCSRAAIIWSFSVSRGR